MNHQTLSSFIWSVADLLRGDYKQSEYGRVILPFTVLRRLDCVLEATKQAGKRIGAGDVVVANTGEVHGVLNDGTTPWYSFGGMPPGGGLRAL